MMRMSPSRTQRLSLWALLALVLAMAAAGAGEFEDWKRAQQGEFRDYQSRMDQEFSDFLRAQWEEFQTFRGLVRDPTPKPTFKFSAIHH